MAPWTLREPITDANYSGCTINNGGVPLYAGYASPDQFYGGQRPLDVMKGRQRQGARIWKLRYSYVRGQDLFPNNLSPNVVGIAPADQGYTSGSDHLNVYPSFNNNSTGDTDSDISSNNLDYHSQKCFHNTIVEKTMNGAIPFIFQPVSDDYTPSGFCMATLEGSPSYSQIAPNLYSVSLTIREIL